MSSVIVHYQELALKGRNRPWFVRLLVRNIREVLSDLDVRSVEALMGRIRVVIGADVAEAVILERLSRVFGVANFAFARQTPTDLDSMAEAASAELDDLSPRSFRVLAKRADKRYALTSPEIERELGGRIRQRYGWPVDLSHADLVVRVEVIPGTAFVFARRHAGAGGLPVGASGRVACLMSGGIDSPVAACRMMKRGCRVRFIHFHSYPIVSTASQDKARELVEVLTRYQLHSRLLLVPFGEVQRRVIVEVPPPFRVVAYRRLMVRIAERLARKSGARALVTGEVVGQVASQTLENLTVTDAAATMTILRPLVGMDKSEITAEAERLGTYPISIGPDEDCCQLFTPPHPATKVRLQQIEAVEERLPIAELVERAVAETVIEDYHFPTSTRRRRGGVDGTAPGGTEEPAPAEPAPTPRHAG